MNERERSVGIFNSVTIYEVSRNLEGSEGRLRRIKTGPSTYTFAQDDGASSLSYYCRRVDVLWS